MLKIQKKVNTSSNIVDICLYLLLLFLMQLKMQQKDWIQLLFLGSYKDIGIGQGFCKPFLQVFRKAEVNPVLQNKYYSEEQ